MPVNIISASSTQFARPGDTTAYAAGDLIANNTSAASVVPLSFTFRSREPFLQIDRALLRKSSTGVTNPSFRLNLYSAIPVISVSGDNGLMSANTTAATTFIGGLSTSGTLTTHLDGGVSNLLPFCGTSAFPLPLFVDCRSLITGGESVKLYGLLEALAAYAPGNAETFDVTIFARPMAGFGE
jgi:hypothetical protein